MLKTGALLPLEKSFIHGFFHGICPEDAREY
jgi:hypothetical protein